jgi:hypothetical protein
MLQLFVPNVLSIFSDICCKCVYLDVVYVLHISYRCFIWMLRMCCNGFQVFYVFFASVLDACFKRFISFRMYVVGVCNWMFFKIGSGVVSLFSPSAASPRCLLFLDAGDVRVT